jgi:glucosylceramidase
MTNRGYLTSLFSCALLSVLGARAEDSPQLVREFLTADQSPFRLSERPAIAMVPDAQPLDKEACVFVDPNKRFQTIVGVGGAITDAAAETFYKLPKEAQDQILTAYFDPEKGIGYSLGRTQINSCDFSSDTYTYVKDGDSSLSTFSVEHDRKYRIPLIRAAAERAGPGYRLFVSPWSPPAWMKDNNDMLRGGHLKPEFRTAWADYYVRFIRAYEKDGIPIWGLTVQNEPMAVQKWESCIYSAGEERDFVKGYLGPALQRAGLGGKKLMIWDHNRTMMYQRAREVLDDPDAARYVWGVAFHWYVDDSFSNVARVSEAYPATHLLFTEGCDFPFDVSKLGEWHWGESYGQAMIQDFNNGAVGWTDWNILVDQTGGPNHVGNFCFAPVDGDTQTGKVTYMNSFYYLGHFSKFVRPGARRIISSSTEADLQTTAFVNEDGKVAVIVMNQTAAALRFSIWMKGQAAPTELPAHSIATFVFPDVVHG